MTWFLIITIAVFFAWQIATQGERNIDVGFGKYATILTIIVYLAMLVWFMLFATVSH